MRRTSLFLIATAALAFAGCSSDSNPQTEAGAPSSTTTSSVVVSTDNAAACKGFEEYKAARSANPPASSQDPEQATKNIQAYLSAVVAPLQTIKAGAPTDLVTSVDTLIASAEEFIALDPAEPENQQQVAQLVMDPPPANSEAVDAMTSWAAVNCGINIAPGG